MFRKKNSTQPQFTVVEPQACDVEYFNRLAQNRWDHSHESTIRLFLKRMRPHDYTESELRPNELAPLLEKLKPTFYRHLKDTASDATDFYTDVAMEMLGDCKSSFDAKKDLPLIELQRPVAIAMTLGIRAGNREVMIGFMRYAGAPPPLTVFGFCAACELAKLREPTDQGKLTREELTDWKIHLLSRMEKKEYTSKTLSVTLELIERELAQNS